SQRLLERRERLHCCPCPQRAPDRDSPLGAAGAVGTANVGAGLVDDFIMRLRASKASYLESLPDLHALYGRNRHEALGEAPVQAAIMMNVRPQPDRQSVGDDLEGSSQG